MTSPRKIDYALIGIVITILLQGAGAVWFAATINSRVDKLEADTATLRAIPVTVARLDERTSSLVEASRRIEAKLDQERSR